MSPMAAWRPLMADRWALCPICGQTSTSAQLDAGWALVTVEGTMIGNWALQKPPTGRRAPDGGPATPQPFDPENLWTLGCGHQMHETPTVVDRPRHPLTCWECKAHITGLISNPARGTYLLPCNHWIDTEHTETIIKEMNDAQNQ